MAFAILVQFPYRICSLVKKRPPLGRTVPKLFGCILIAALILNWLIPFAR